ncbi:hypothetical protein GF342_03180 [Candidatus Woesearchaeota archaeon]|nr:hypothetical protein [Candidatus Woesearchaeota archaeon]
MRLFVILLAVIVITIAAFYGGMLLIPKDSVPSFDPNTSADLAITVEHSHLTTIRGEFFVDKGCMGVVDGYLLVDFVNDCERAQQFEYSIVEVTGEVYVQNCSPNEQCSLGPRMKNIQNISVLGTVPLETRCCRECELEYQTSPAAVGPQSAICGDMPSANPVSGECEAYFKGKSLTVVECGFS